MRASAAAVAALALGVADAIDNGLGLTPPMGWRSWNLFFDHVNQSLLERVMDGMVARKRTVDGVPTSLCDLGYCDVGLDDAWQACGKGEDGYQYHDSQGRPVINTERFPNMTAMTAKAHGLGLTAGWYANNCICMEGKEPTQAMYAQDVHFLTDVFQFDAIKLDGCGKQLDLDVWARLINQSGRRVMIENCHWGFTVPNETWCPWNYFRSSGDVTPTYGSVVANLLTTVQWAQRGLSRPGCWAYPDMLEVGCTAQGHSLTAVETRTHFGAWCIVSSPLILSHDVDDDSVVDEIWPIISNKEAIAINQAWAGHSGSPFKQAAHTIALPGLSNVDGTWLWESASVPSWQYFYKPLGGGRAAVLMINHDAKAQELTLDPHDIPGLVCSGVCTVRDVWAHQDLPAIQGTLARSIASHDSAFLVLAPVGAESAAIVL